MSYMTTKNSPLNFSPMRFPMLAQQQQTQTLAQKVAHFPQEPIGLIAGTMAIHQQKHKDGQWRVALIQ